MKSFFRILSFIMLLLGTSTLAYPYISSVVHNKAQEQIIIKSENSSKHLNQSQLDAEKKKVKTYDDNLVGEPLHDPFADGAGFVIQSKDYLAILNLNGDGVMGSLEIPKIHLKLPIYHGVDEHAISHGAGHIPYTSTPYGGIGRHTFLSSHRGLPNAILFTDLNVLKNGDYANIQILGETHWYKMIDSKVIKPAEFVATRPDPNRDLLTLVTCTPYSVNTHRLLVTLERTKAPDLKTQQAITKKVSTPIQSLYFYLAVIAIAFGILFIFMVIFKFIKKRWSLDK